MLNKIIKEYQPGSIQTTSERLKILNKAGTVLVTFNKVRRTGTFLNKPVYNELFIKLKKKVYIPLTSALKSKEELTLIMENKKRRSKIVKYYTKEEYKKINGVFVYGEDPYTSLPLALALWVDYDLIRPYYKNAPIEEIDKTLWAYQMFYQNKRYRLFYKYFTGNKACYGLYGVSSGGEQIAEKKRFTLFGYLDLVDTGGLPLIYKDGILISSVNSVLNDLIVYDKPTTAEVIKTIFKKLLQIQTLVNYKGRTNLIFPIIDIFPYMFITSLTDYGYVVNLFKLNMETGKHKLVLSREVHCESMDKTIQKLTGRPPEMNVRIEKDMEKVKTYVQKVEGRPYSRLNFGIDKDYVYLYYSPSDPWFYSQKIIIDMIKVPLKEIDSVTLYSLHQERIYGVFIDAHGKTVYIKTPNYYVNTKISHSHKQKS